MSQNPNYNPYGQNPPDPNVPPGTSYGSPPPPPGQSQGSAPNYGPYNPYTPNPPTPGPAVNPIYNPYDPYAPTVAGQGSSPDYNPYAPPAPPVPPPPQPRLSGISWRVILLVVLALVLVIGGIAFGLVSYTTTQTNNANATATAHANAQTATVQSNLTATAVAQVNATATFVTNPYPPNSGSLTLFDPLKDNSKGHRWDEGTYSGGARCQFTGGTYHVSEGSKNTFYPCFANTTNFGNFAYQAEMTILRGDCGGLVFRADSTNFKVYFFEICQEEAYDIVLYSGNSGKYLVDHTTNAAIKTGLNQTNVIAVVANGGMIQVYVNNTSLDNVVDNSFSQGKIGVLADEYNNSTEVAFDNVKVWTL